MNALHRKVLRDLRTMRGQMTAIGFVIASGVAAYVAMQSVKHALEDTLADYYAGYRFADGFASLRRASERVQGRLRAIPGLAELETRVVAPVTLEIAGFDEAVSGRLVSIPEGRQPGLNRIFLRTGRLPRRGQGDEVLLNELFADAHHLAPGDRLGAIVNGRRRALRVVGIALSPEYLMQVQPGTLFPDPLRYGVLWMGREALAAAYDMDGAFNDAAWTLAPGAGAEDVIRSVDLVLEPYGGVGAIGRKDQPSHFMINEEFRQLRTSSTLLPLVFIAVAAFLLNIAVTRLIALQREQIGVLKAFGYANTAVGAHYLELVLVVVAAGSAVGAALGLWLGRLMGGLYLAYYRFPALDYSTSVRTVAEAVLLTAGAVVLGVLHAVGQAVRLAPAIAMREPMPGLYHPSFLERAGLRRALDQPSRMILRSISRRPWRSVLTMTGIASSCAILIMGLFFRDSFDFVMHVQYGLAQRDNLQVTFSEATSARAVHELAALPGVRHAEPFRSVPVRLRRGHRRYDTAIEGVPPASYLRRVIGADLAPIAMPRGGIVLTDRLAQILDAREGDAVTVDVREGRRWTRTVTVARVARQFIGVAAYMDLEALGRLAGGGPAISGAYLMTDRGRDAALTEALRRRPRVAGQVSQERAVAALTESYERSILTVTFIMSLFAGVIAFGVVYNSARIALSERDRELASLRVLGFTRREVGYILLGEQGLLTLAAIPLGMVLGALMAAGMVEATQTDLYQFPLVLGRGTLGLAAAVVLVAAAVSAVIVRRRLNRLDLIGVLKTRE